MRFKEPTVRSLFTTLSILFLAVTAIQAGALPADSVRGTVADSSGSPLEGVHVALTLGKAEPRTTVTSAKGVFTFAAVPPGPATLVASFGSLEPVILDLESERQNLEITMQAIPMSEQITVSATRPKTRIVSATKTDTLLRDVPQSITVVTKDVIRQQAMQGMADVVRFVPGVGMASGEGNRDTPIFRGNSSTSDFFVDGVRDDVQYFRDLYNVERVEALKGPNAMIFGRGGVGGVINRVTRKADFAASREINVQAGSWDDRRVTADFGQALNSFMAGRITGMFEESNSYRKDANLSRYGINPSLAFAIGESTTVTASYELFHDERTADRGISSFAGGPVMTDASTFFGNADLSRSDATVNSVSTAIEHRFSSDVTLRNRTGFAVYDKFYQNVFPGTVDQSGRNVSISAYNNATDRRNIFNQTDLVMSRRFADFDHTILAGVEIGRQVTDNFRQTGYFASVGANTTTVMVPLESPTTSLPLTFRQSATDADNHGVATVMGVYVQDQIDLSTRLQLIAGLRYDNFQVDLQNNRTGARFATSDGLLSPRIGVVFHPIKPVSMYTSYSLSYLPRAGEQLSSLSLSNQALEPEQFRNYEAGVKWDVNPSLAVTTAVYQLDRGNVAVTDPADPTRTMLVDGQRTRGFEADATGYITPRWNVTAAYTWQDGEITRSLTPTAQAGARLAQLPEHSIALWNMVDLTVRWSAGLGLNHRTEVFTSTDNSVVLPAFTRVDAALFFSPSDRIGMQINVENLLDTDYYAFAHSNTNITPGAPRSVRVNWTTRF
jgi:catecholate siderophore receptor